jgi:hypothetical protein
MKRFARRLVIAVIAAAGPLGMLLAVTPSVAATPAPSVLVLTPDSPFTGCLQVGFPPAFEGITYRSTWSLPDGETLVISQFQDPSCSRLNSVESVSGHGHGTFTLEGGFFYEIFFGTIPASHGSIATFTPS